MICMRWLWVEQWLKTSSMWDHTPNTEPPSIFLPSSTNYPTLSASEEVYFVKRTVHIIPEYAGIKGRAFHHFSCPSSHNYFFSMALSFYSSQCWGDREGSTSLWHQPPSLSALSLQTWMTSFELSRLGSQWIQPTQFYRYLLKIGHNSYTHKSKSLKINPTNLLTVLSKCKSLPLCKCPY